MKVIAMEAFCEDCTKVAQREYWNKGSNYKFFKIILCDFEQQLRIPKKFVDSLNGKLSGWRILKGPSGNRWVVNIKRTSKDTFFFSDGWDKFVIDHGIKSGHVLVFNYDNYASEFKVTIFDGSSCEVESSHFVININPSTPPSLSSSYPCTSALHGIVGYELESDIKNDIHLVGVEDNDNGNGNDEKSCSIEDEIDNGMHGDDYGNNDDYDYDYNDDDDDDDDYDYDEEEEEEYNRKRKRGCSFKIGTSSVQQRKQRHIDYKSNRRQVTIHEKERAKQMALEYLMRNECNGPPMFQVTMLPTHVYSGFHLTIPKVWAVRHMYEMSHCVELRVAGVASRWLVGCRWSRGRQCQIIKGWAKFVLDHNLEEHDVCVFELLKPWLNQCNGYPLFQVHVFRVVEQLVPFTLTRRNL